MKEGEGKEGKDRRRGGERGEGGEGRRGRGGEGRGGRGRKRGREQKGRRGEERQMTFITIHHRGKSDEDYTYKSASDISKLRLLASPLLLTSKANTRQTAT